MPLVSQRQDLLHEPIACEARDDTTANQANQHEERSYAEAIAECGRRGNTDSLRMNKAIAQKQEGKRDQHWQVAPIPSR